MNRLLPLYGFAIALVDCASPRPAAAAIAPAPVITGRLLTSNEMFGLAEAADRRGDPAVAEAAYRALTEDPVLAVRSEARFRLAMKLARNGGYARSAMLLRRILDEEPGALRVRLELARMLDLMGDEDGARRLLREAQAAGLPPDVVRFVDRYSAALRARKPFGGSIDLAIAPDSNINRATRGDTLGTVIGDFVLDDDAKQRSGVGLAIHGQVYRRFRLSERASLLARLSGAADIYRKGDFSTVALGISVGPEFLLGRDRLAIDAGATRRMLGGKPLSSTVTLGASLLHPLDKVSQLRIAASVGSVAQKLNRLQSGRSYAAAIAYERALSPTAGIGASLGVDRQSLRDPGYSTRCAQATLFAYRELGATTLVASVSHGRLRADERQFLFPDRRKDRFDRASLGATFRRFAVRGFAPFVRLSYERNRSSVGIFDYRRARSEVGIARAF